MPASINVAARLKAAGRGQGVAGQPDALKVREVDALVSQLLDEIEIPFGSLGKRVVARLAELKKVLAADYRQAPGLPAKPLLVELARIVEREVKTREIWKRWNDPQSFGPLIKLFGPREIDVRAEPYRQGAGLALRGFFCRANVGTQAKFVIFLNTAHHPGAVAATFGHELGHYLYGALVGESSPMTAFMEGTFAAHLNEEHELFADSLVALAAYSTEQIEHIAGISALKSANSDNFLSRVHQAYEAIAPRLKLDLRQEGISAPWRVCYLTSMIHFFKLRCALLDTAQL
jgi:hypothetical protein